jgi:hypothetical protein
LPALPLELEPLPVAPAELLPLLLGTLLEEDVPPELEPPEEAARAVLRLPPPPGAVIALPPDLDPLVISSGVAPTPPLAPLSLDDVPPSGTAVKGGWAQQTVATAKKTRV